MHYVKYCNFIYFPGMEILWKGIVSAMQKLCFSTEFSGNYAFPQNFHIRKLGEITVFYAVLDPLKVLFRTNIEKQLKVTTTSIEIFYWVDKEMLLVTIFRLTGRFKIKMCLPEAFSRISVFKKHFWNISKVVYDRNLLISNMDYKVSQASLEISIIKAHNNLQSTH